MYVMFCSHGCTVPPFENMTNIIFRPDIFLFLNKNKSTCFNFFIFKFSYNTATKECLDREYKLSYLFCSAVSTAKKFNVILCDINHNGKMFGPVCIVLIFR